MMEYIDSVFHPHRVGFARRMFHFQGDFFLEKHSQLKGNC